MDDILEKLRGWLALPSLIVTVLIAVIVFLAVLRYVTRHIFGLIRIRNLGGVDWYKISYDGRKTNRTSTDRFLAETKSLIDLMNRKSGVGPNKSFLSFVITSGSEDVASGVVEAYAVVPSKKITDSEVKRWANGINCYAEEVDPPLIDGRYPSFAMNSDYQTAEIVNEVEESRIGSVIAALQPQSDNDIIEGTVVLTIEPMSSGEAGMIVNDANSRINNMSEDGEYSGTSRQTNLMKASAVRSMVASVGLDKDSSRDILSTSMSRMVHLPVETKNSTPAREYVKIIPFMLFLSLIPVGLGKLMSMPFLVTTGIVSIAVTLLSIFSCGLLSNLLVTKQIQNGVLFIPPFWRFSVRRVMLRKVRAAFTAKRNLSDNDFRHTAKPSVRQVIPMYAVPVLEFSTLPSATTGRNVANTSLPVIGYKKSFESKLESHKDGRIIIGASTAGQPLARTLDTLEFGSVWGGSAGSGKTNGLMIDFTGMSRLSYLGSLGPIDGRDIRISPLWLETKSEGAYDVIELVKDYNPIFISAHDIGSRYRLSIEGTRYISEEETPLKKVVSSSDLFVDSMLQVYGKNGLGPRSKDILSSVHTLSLLLSPNELSFLGLGDYLDVRNPNVIASDFYLIGGDANYDAFGKMSELAVRIQAEDNDHKDRALRLKRLNDNVLPDNQEVTDIRNAMIRNKEVISNIGRLVKIKKDDSSAFGPIANKLNPMRRSEGMFNPAGDRIKISVDDIIKSFRPVIINMGAVKQDDGTFLAAVSDTSSRELLTAFHFMLWSRISALCSGWKSAGKYIPIYADELIDILPQDDDAENLVDRVRAQGRSKGCSHNIGFQSFSQMTQTTQSTIKSFETRLFLKMASSDDVEIMMKTFGESAGEIGADTLMTLKQGSGVGRMVIDNQETTMPFTFMTPAAEFVKKAIDHSGGDLDEVQEEIYEVLGV